MINQMSKPVKEMIVADYKKRFENIDDALLIDIRGVNANDNNKTYTYGIFGK